ncbi:uncharacterized protein LOC128265316 [Drosophila gunungcola]|uniref:uncharacterized protein LOC128265316 n=1 Tax=Drosophila gunungcola TaxID=103775 RepID=UPI0022E2F897|nr:uncharacterized protein LOC128265316 [Drosophila gunungcola]XP_052857198.1 uncharacterized protein LOC128265316 [Drosophila gunungcola]
MSDDEKGAGSAPKCVLCEKTLASAPTLQIKCGHKFHKVCFESYAKTRNSCPICKETPHDTRQRKRQNTPAGAGSSSLEEAEQVAISQHAIGNIVAQQVKAMQNDLLAQLSEKMAQLIQVNLAAHMPPQSNVPPAINARRLSESVNFQVGGPTSIVHGSGLATPRTEVNELAHRPDKVCQIVNSWKLRFSGSKEGLSVDNFIYRVQALTEQTLDSNYEALCGNASILFEGKARDFYWRFHKSVRVVNWDGLCCALRKQFRDTRSDVDIREAIRDRKQKDKEDFDTFHDAVVQLMDNLEYPMPERDIVDTLSRNLRPEIRHELLNIRISSVDSLREICRRRERFLEDVKRNYSYQKTIPFRKNVAELVEEAQSDDATEFSDVEVDGEIGAMALICWNCRQEGHRYHDCEGKRKIFCFGCGRPNTYKPSCVKCQKKRQDEHTASSAVVCSAPEADESRDEPVETLSSTDLLNLSEKNHSPLTFWPQLVKSNQRLPSPNPVCPKKRSRNASRIRAFWSAAKTINAIRYKKYDKRPYAEVRVLDQVVLGLLDTGAAMSALGGKLAEQVVLSRIPFKRVATVASTADGKRQEIIGRLKIPVQYKKITKDLELHIIPSLSQDLYLGIDFWQAFDLLPASMNIAEIAPESHDLTTSQQEILKSVVALFPSFAISGLGKTSLISHTIDIGDAKPVKQRHFPVSPAVEKLLYEEVDRMLSLGVIEESDSAWSSPVVLVQKPGKIRLCLDSRKVNAVTKKDAYPLPQIDGILGRLPKAMFISSLDLKDAYWQIPLDKASRDKTAFTIPGKPLYQYKVMPFGLTNASQTMTRLMDKVIPASLRNEVFVYLDDLLIISESFEAHMRVLSLVAGFVKTAGLTLNVEKSKFCMRSVKYLGHIVGEGVIRTDPEKISAMKDFPLPQSLKALRRFLGMAGWYRKFIKNFSSVTAALTDLLKPRKKFVMSEEGERAFEQLKKCCVRPQFCTAQILVDHSLYTAMQARPVWEAF